MNRKKLLYGLAAGAIGYIFYKMTKHKLKPMAVKTLEGAFTIGEGAREIITDISEEAKENYEKKRNELLERKKILESQGTTGIDNKKLTNDIEELEIQLSALEQKLSNLKS